MVNSQWLMLLLIVFLLLINPTMLISLKKVANSSKQQQQEELDPDQVSRGQLLGGLIPAKQLSQRPRRLPSLISSPSNLPGTVAVERSKSSTFRPKLKVESEVQLRHKRQHAFELGLEEMLFEVAKGWAANFGINKHEKEKEVVNKVGEKPPGWQKVWYKRLG